MRELPTTTTASLFVVIFVYTCTVVVGEALQYTVGGGEVVGPNVVCGSLCSHIQTP